MNSCLAARELTIFGRSSRAATFYFIELEYVMDGIYGCCTIICFGFALFFTPFIGEYPVIGMFIVGACVLFGVWQMLCFRDSSHKSEVLYTNRSDLVKYIDDNEIKYLEAMYVLKNYESSGIANINQITDYYEREKLGKVYSFCVDYAMKLQQIADIDTTIKLRKVEAFTVVALGVGIGIMAGRHSYNTRKY